MKTLRELFPDQDDFFNKVTKHIILKEKIGLEIVDAVTTFKTSNYFHKTLLTGMVIEKFYKSGQPYFNKITELYNSTYDLLATDYANKQAKLIYFYIFQFLAMKEVSHSINLGNGGVYSKSLNDPTYTFISEDWPENLRFNIRLAPNSRGSLWFHEISHGDRHWTFTNEIQWIRLCNGAIQESNDYTRTSEDIIRHLHVPAVDRDFYFNKCSCGSWKFVNDHQCQICIKDLLPTGNVINEYSCRVPQYLPTQFKGAEKHTFGFEIEVEHDSNSTRGLRASALELYKVGKKYLLCKRDGSIRNGCEIVTIPATFSVHKERLVNLSAAMQANGFYSNHNCGVHIHVGKDNMSALQLGKISTFIYADGNKEMIESIAGRRGNNYCEYNKDSNLYSFAPDYYHRGNNNRYSAVNINNEATIEFRIFASTTKYAELMRYLEFVDAVIKFTLPATKPILHLEERDQFLNFIKTSNVFNVESRKKEKEFPHLLSFLVNSGFIANKPRKEI